MNFKLAALPVLGFLLVACTTTGGGAGEGAKPATLGQPATSEQQQRAKNHIELGSLYYLEGRSAIALEEARLALASDPDYAPAFNLLAMTHMLLNEPRLAEENFQKAMRLAPGDPEISNNYGWFLCQNGREQQSIAHFMAAAKNPLYTAPTTPGAFSDLMKPCGTAQELHEVNFALSPTIQALMSPTLQ